MVNEITLVVEVLEGVQHLSRLRADHAEVSSSLDLPIRSVRCRTIKGVWRGMNRIVYTALQVENVLGRIGYGGVG
jgi:hypothetical protein